MTDQELFEKLKREGEEWMDFYWLVTVPEDEWKRFGWLWERIPDGFIREHGDGQYIDANLIDPTLFTEALKQYLSVV